MRGALEILQHLVVDISHFVGSVGFIPNPGVGISIELQIVDSGSSQPAVPVAVDFRLLFVVLV